MVSAGLLLLLGLPIAAHEFWVTPSAWVVQPGARAMILAHVGDQFPGANSFTSPERIETVRLIGPSSDTLVPPPYRREKDSLAADVQVPAVPGPYIGVVIVKPCVGQKSGAIFQSHIAHQGLDDVTEYRAAHGETDTPVRERYSRYGKTLLRVGSGGDNAHVTRPLGLKLELVPLTDPTALPVGSRLRIRLLLDGQPAPNALVGAVHASANAKPEVWPLTSRTDAQGQAEFVLADAGPWLLRSVRSVRRAGETGELAADWESYWASLSFSLLR
ncbi:MAG: DUF4198 domain-containing protein [Acidobacteria bacterium]|nr:DUF4198 domain-containing protein [Acidobacteriota bacterium]